MSFKVLNLYYQYANCISETNNFYKKSLITRFFSPVEASNLQLLSISLPDSNDSEDFILSKELLNIMNSYSAQFSQSEFDSLDFEFIEFILYVLTIIIKVLELNYKELSDIHEQDLLETQINFILEGVPLFFQPNNFNKEVVLNKLNKYESIVSNEKFQAILKKVLDL